MREVHFPKDTLLKKYVNYISFYQAGEGKREFFVFPNPGAAIALHKRHSFLQQGKNVFHAVHRDTDHQLLHINRLDPVQVIDEGERTSITIVFHPLGINHFIPENLSAIMKTANRYSYIDIGAWSFSGFATSVFMEPGRNKQLALIEQFLLRKFREPKIPYLQEAIALLTDFDTARTIPEICNSIGTSPRNLSRLFHKHICLSPVEFRNICQFRFSLHKKIESGTKALKDIGYESNYSDPSYMVRMYRKYTGLNPGSFFDKVTVDSNYVFLAL